MAKITVSFDEYSSLYEKGDICPSDSYIIDGDVSICDGGSVLCGVTVCGSVYISADAYDVAVVKCRINGSVVSAASSVVIRDCETSSVTLDKGSANTLVARNKVEKIDIYDGFNCSVVLNLAQSVCARGGKNIYIIDNTVEKKITLSNIDYLLCDGNICAETVKDGCTNYNGDNLRDVDARLEVGADEDLLPHTNKDLFIDMTRRDTVLDPECPYPMTFNEYFLNGAESGDVVIIPPGAYREDKPIVTTAAHANTTVYAYGAMRENIDYGPSIDIEGTSSLTIKGLTVGYAKQSSGQIHVLEKLPDYKLRVINAAGYDYGFAHTDFKKYSGSTEVFHPGRFTNWTVYSHPYYKVVEECEDKTFVLQMLIDREKLWGNMSPGEVWSCRMAGQNTHTFMIRNAGNILFKDVTVYGYGAALGLVGYATRENVRFVRVHNTSRAPFVIDKEAYDKYKALEEQYGVDLEVSIDSQGRCRGSIPRTGSVDAMHINAGFEGVSATSCLFEHMCDDGSNQHSASSRLHRLIDNGDGTTTLVYKGLLTEIRQYLYTVGGETSGTGASTVPFATGDRVFCYTSNGRVVCDCEVLEGNFKFSDEKYHLLTFDYSFRGETRTIVCECDLWAIRIPTDKVNFNAIEGYDLDDNSKERENRVIVDNVSRCSAGYTFDNVLVRHTRARGIAVKSRNVTVKSCTFREIGSAGIMLSCEENWAENTVAVNTVVKNCIFDNTGRKFEFNHDMKFGAFAIEGLGGMSRYVTPAGDGFPCSNVLLEGNLFINNSHDYDVAISEAMNVTIRNNTFSDHVLDSGEIFLGTTVKASNCLNITLEGNKYSPLSEGKTEKIFDLADCKNVVADGVKII